MVTIYACQWVNDCFMGNIRVIGKLEKDIFILLIKQGFIKQGFELYKNYYHRHKMEEDLTYLHNNIKEIRLFKAGEMFISSKPVIAKKKVRYKIVPKSPASRSDTS